MTSINLRVCQRLSVNEARSSARRREMKARWMRWRDDPCSSAIKGQMRQLTLSAYRARLEKDTRHEATANR
jgi:hypothetical protein